MELVKKIESLNILKKISIVLLGTLLLTISAKIKIPFYPVPMTMQTFVVLFLGISFGWKIGLATISLYLLRLWFFALLLPYSHHNPATAVPNLDAVSPTTVLGEDADIGHTPAGGLTLSQNEKRRRDGYQLSVFYTIYFRTTSRRGTRTACIDPIEPRLRSSKHGDLTCL